MEHPIFPIKLAHQQAQQNGHRLAIHLACSQEEGYRSAEYLLTYLLDTKALSDYPPFLCQSSSTDISPQAYFDHFERVHLDNLQALLGRDALVVLFDGFCGFNPNLLAAASGTLRAGGLFILLAPPTARWPTFSDPEYHRFTDLDRERSHIRPNFLTRLADCFTEDESLITVQAHDLFAYKTKLNPFTLNSPQEQNRTVINPPTSSPPIQTEEQQALISRLYHCTAALKLITAHRGRGKSAALGRLIAKWVLEQEHEHVPQHIVVTATRKEMVNTLYAHLASALIDHNHFPSTFQWHTGPLQLGSITIQYRAPIQLRQWPKSDEPIDLLIADEAAAIPYDILVHWLDSLIAPAPDKQQSVQIILATTTDGYEGTGNSFQTRLLAHLKNSTLSWQHYALLQPIRWQANDPLERLMNHALMLSPRLSRKITDPVQPTARPIQRFTPEQSLSTTIESIQALLTLAHYRTTPSDFRQLLEGPGNHVFYISQPAPTAQPWLSDNTTVVGVLWAVEEGVLPDALCDAIMANKRRLKGHLLPQSILLYQRAHSLEAKKRLAGGRYLRIVRLAIHPHLQSKGLGSALVHHLIHYAQNNAFSAVGTSFGDDPALNQFWTRCHFKTIRLGEKKSTVTGSKARVMLYPISETTKQL